LRRARLATLTLSSTVQNHPKALRQIENHWSQLSSSLCPSSSSTPKRTTPLGTAIFSLLPPTPEPTTEAETTTETITTTNHTTLLPDPSLTKIRVTLVTGLLKSPTLRAQFLAGEGPSHVLQILIS